MKPLISLLMILLSNLTFALPQESEEKHNGVASCATSVCHGKTAAVQGRNVWLNEYHLWSTEDHHSRAYRTLLSPASKTMAKRLGLPNAHTADVCLDCHADNVPLDKRGKKFQISDGVGCEACHGGSEQWLKSHTDPDATHQRNVEQGLYQTDKPYDRAELCLSCHMGTNKKFADHQMMAAGHPRLVFELDTFTANQPAHYALDGDYIKRKGNLAVGYLWLVGQVESANQLLNLIEQHGGQYSAKHLAILDCHACHQPMTIENKARSDLSKPLSVGSLRLFDYPFDMLAIILKVNSPADLPQWEQSIGQLHLAASDQQQLKAVINQLRPQISQLKEKLKQSSPSTATLKSIRKEIVSQAADGKYLDFSSAEQAFLALESLSFGLEDHGRYEKYYDELYQTVGDEFNYDATKFALSAKRLLKQL